MRCTGCGAAKINIENERFLSGVHVIVKTIYFEILLCRLGNYVKEFHIEVRAARVAGLFSSFNQRDHCFLALSLPLLLSLLW